MKITNLNDVPSIAAYLSRIHAIPRTIRAAIVETVKGRYWKDAHIVRFNPAKLEVIAPEDVAPTEGELKAIQKDMATYQWPTAKLLGRNYEPPEQLKLIDPENLFEFRNMAGQLIMLQERTEETDRGKYRPWTCFDDYMWRMCEPEGPLPLWGMEHLGNNTTVFLHEGAKAARAMHRLTNPTTDEGRRELEQHPWGRELTGAVHLGWIGGALNPGRTDWSVLSKSGVKQAFIVADNDDPGRRAIADIAKHLHGITVFSITFNKHFPPSFDMADPWPQHFFVERDGVSIYRGPQFLEHLRPATWATDLTKAGKKMVPVLRDEFKNVWGWVEETDLYICLQRPVLRFRDKVFNGHMSALSHTKDVSVLLKRELSCQYGKMAYRPDTVERIIGHSGEPRTINLYMPSLITPQAGDPAPWLEFMSYLFPVKHEHHHMMRWCATLIARPEIRMAFAALLISVTHGVGKNTLGEKILAPLVGRHNCSFPNESDIVDSQFNSWVVNKRLAVVNEIYTGRSWKAANKLKAYITDRETSVNEKYINHYTTENWVHVMAFSNSMRALKLEDSDRRWFVPTLTENPWPREKWVWINRWIEGNGLRIIRNWADRFDDYVLLGETAPMTDRKKDIQRESESDAMQLLRSFCEANMEIPVSVAEKALRDYLARETPERRVYESTTELRRAMSVLGWKTFDERLKVEGLLQWVIMSPQTGKELANRSQDVAERRKYVRSTIAPPVDIAVKML